MIKLEVKFKAFDQDRTEYFETTATNEDIILKLAEVCETFVWNGKTKTVETNAEILQINCQCEQPDTIDATSKFCLHCRKFLS